MSDLPKLLSPVLIDRDGWVRYGDTAGDGGYWSVLERDQCLAERGQRPKGGVWPDGFGVVELEDVPKPEPLPTAYLWRSTISGRTEWTSEATDEGPNYTLAATVTFDENDVATVTRHTA